MYSTLRSVIFDWFEFWFYAYKSANPHFCFCSVSQSCFELPCFASSSLQRGFFSGTGERKPSPGHKGNISSQQRTGPASYQPMSFKQAFIAKEVGQYTKHVEGGWSTQTFVSLFYSMEWSETNAHTHTEMHTLTRTPVLRLWRLYSSRRFKTSPPGVFRAGLSESLTSWPLAALSLYLSLTSSLFSSQNANLQEVRLAAQEFGSVCLNVSVTKPALHLRLFCRMCMLIYSGPFKIRRPAISQLA